MKLYYIEYGRGANTKTNYAENGCTKEEVLKFVEEHIEEDRCFSRTGWTHFFVCRLDGEFDENKNQIN